MIEWINIRISKELHAELSSRGRKSETFDATIKRLISEDEDYKKDVM